jgi:hypothetical protein
MAHGRVKQRKERGEEGEADVWSQPVSGGEKKKRGARSWAVAGEDVGSVGRCWLKGEGEVLFYFFSFSFFKLFLKFKPFQLKTFQTFFTKFYKLFKPHTSKKTMHSPIMMHNHLLSLK